MIEPVLPDFRDVLLAATRIAADAEVASLRRTRLSGERGGALLHFADEPLRGSGAARFRGVFDPLPRAGVR